MNHPKLAHKEEPVFNGLGVFSNSVDALLRASEDPSALITELKQHWPRLSVLAISEWTSKQETETQHLADRSQLQRSLENALNLVCNQNFATAFYKCFFDRRGWLPKIREEQRASKNEVDTARRAFERSVSVCGLCELLMRCDDVSRVEWWLDKARSFLADPHGTPMTGSGERLLKACSDRTELSDLLDELSFTRDSKFLTLQQLGHRPSPESSTVNVVFNLDRAEIPTFFALGSLTLELIDGSGDIMPHPETYLAFTAEWHDALAEVWNGKAQKWFPGKSLVWRLQMENFFEVIHGRSVQGSALAGLYCLSKRLEYPSELVISASIRNDKLEKVSGISSNGSPGLKLEAIAEDDSLTIVIVARSTYAELTSHSLKKWERTNTKRLVPVETCNQLFSHIDELRRERNQASKLTRRFKLAAASCVMASLFFGGAILKKSEKPTSNSPVGLTSTKLQDHSGQKERLSVSTPDASVGFVQVAQSVEPSVVQSDHQLAFETNLSDAAKKLLEDCRQKNIHSIGVLEFPSIYVEDGELTQPNAFKYLGGQIGARVAKQLELSLILSSSNDDKVDIVSNATKAALDAGISDHFSPQNRCGLLEIEYPVAWGSSKSKPDRLFTGEVRFSQQLDRMLVLIQSFDSRSQTLQLETVFIAMPYWVELSEAGKTFRKSTEPLDGRSTHPLKDPAMPLEMTCLLNGRTSEIQIREGEATIEEPKVDDHLEIKISRRDPKDDRPYAFVLKVNGLNTIESQRASDLSSSKWALGPDDDEIVIRGFYRDGDIVEPFQVLNGKQSSELFKYLQDPGRISLTVFQQLSPWAPKDDTVDKDVKILRHAERLGINPLTRVAYKFALQKNQNRGLIKWGVASAAITERLSFEVDPIPLFSASVRYYQD